jgi:two-component system sporulation sensor kinase B
MELVKDIILQITFIILPIFFYHLFWLSKSHSNVLKTNKVLITCSTILSSLLCTLSPIDLIHGLFFNLQAIPLFVSFVYGGYVPGILTLITILVFRIFILDLDLSYIIPSLITYSAIPILFKSKWKDFGLKKKYIMTLIYGGTIVCITLLYFCIVSVFLTGRISLENLLVLSGYFFVLIFMLLITIYLIEYMRENAMIRRELVHAEKLAIVSELAASVAHEVRNPLTVVRGFVQLIGSSTDINLTQKREYMNLVLTELDRAQSIISDYLGLAGEQYITKEKIDLSETLEEIKTIMTSFANFKTVAVKGDIGKNLYVIGDKAKLKQVFINIIKNAIEAVPNVDGKVSIKAFVSHEVVRIKVSDNGVGMTYEQIARLGEPYYTLKEKGTGLGLTVTYSIIKNHGGSIRYKSEPQKGTVAIVTLPYHLEKDENDTTEDYSFGKGLT